MNNMDNLNVQNNSKYIAFCDDLKKREKSILAFYNSPIYVKMVADIKRKEKSLTSYEWKLFPEKTRELFGWGDDIYDNHINTFIYCLSYENLPKENQIEEDEATLYFNRDGLKVKIVIEDVVQIIINPTP
jgi:hypothetical protein